MTGDEEAELTVLQSDPDGLFAIGLGGPTEPDVQQAFSRGLLKRWYELIDIRIMTNAEGTPLLMKVFKLTSNGKRHRDYLKVKEQHYAKSSE